MKRPRIGFCSLWDARDPHQFSGYAHSMYHALQRQGFDLVDILPLARPPRLVDRARQMAARLTGRFYYWDREPQHLRAVAAVIERRAREAGVDLLFAPSSTPLAAVDPAIPKIFATDQVFSSLLDGYVRRPVPRYRKQGLRQERQILSGASAATYPSTWAIEAACRLGADPARLHLIPWGANLARVPERQEVEQAVAARRTGERCELLFIGREWRRKGGDIVLATLAELRRLGVPARLTVIGTRPPQAVPEGSEVVPFLDKSTEAGHARFTALMRRSHVLFVPSRAEAYGQVFCEAAAFGLPVLATRVGGIPSIVTQDRTGFLLPASSSPTHFAEQAARLWHDPDGQGEMALAARHRFEQLLNWDSFGTRLADLLNATIGYSIAA